jgi:hypothetical protein
MKIFLSGVEGGDSIPVIQELMNKGYTFHYNLMSFYYIKKNNIEYVKELRDKSELILIDSGAHSFQFGKKVNWEEYTKQYAKFIKEFDRPNVVGYFEMDIENIIGYDEVLKLRKILEKVSDKIIPVWHPDRGIKDYEEMCKKYHDKVIAIGGFRGTDIKDNQFIMFMKVARKYNCKVHCLGMTRKKVLDQVPFDFTDSSSWIHHAIYGNMTGVNKKVSNIEYAKRNKKKVIKHNYIQGMKMQEHYYKKWRKECKD